MTHRELREQLELCETQLRLLKEDRDHLRTASSEFADLAERLADQVRLLRRQIENLQEKERSGG